MAERRMFSRSIVESGKFIEMPKSAQALYFHLCMHSDDDGVISSAKGVMRFVNCKPKDLKTLVENGYLLDVGNDLYVVSHWTLNNQIRADRYKTTIYQEALKGLRSTKFGYELVSLDDNQLTPSWLHRKD